RRCNDAGVRVYPDAIINHMVGIGADPCIGTGGSTCSGWDFPGVPFNKSEFHEQGQCTTPSGNVESWTDREQLHYCRLFGLLDLNQALESVRGKIVDMMNRLIDIGVAGFRIDAGTHM